MGWPWGQVTDEQGRACRMWCPANKVREVRWVPGPETQGRSGQQRHLHSKGVPEPSVSSLTSRD